MTPTTQIVRQSQPVIEHDYLTDALTREAVDFIDRHKTRPFFLYLAYNAVHSPLQGADDYMKRFEHIDDIHRRIFAAMLSNLDDSVGSVLTKLEKSQLLDNTLIFFLSDNGGPTRELTSNNLPLRGEKGQVYEGGLRVPFLCQWNDRIEPGKTFDAPVVSLDISATALSAAGATRNSKADGIDLLPHLTGDRDERPHEELFWRMNTKAAIRSGDWKAVRNARSQSAKWELFDLKEDLSEQRNLAGEDPGRLRKLVARWHELNNQMEEPVRW